MVKPMVHSEKHYKQDSLFAIASGAITTKTIIKAVAVVDKNAVNEVEEGSVIKAVYLEYWLTGDDTVGGTFIAIMEKVPANATAITTAQIALLNDYPNKKNVLNTVMGLSPPNTQYPMNIYKGWYKIPKGKQRFGLGDELTISFFGQSDGLTMCGFGLYKEYK